MDRKGEACKVFDCVLNDEVCKTATKGHRQLKNFIIELAMGWIQHKVCPLLPPLIAGIVCHESLSHQNGSLPSCLLRCLLGPLP